MNSPKDLDALRDVIGRVLEQAAFMFTDDDANLFGFDPTRVPLVQVTVNFSGSHSGAVELILPLSLCEEFAVNMLGTEPGEPLSRESQTDAGMEIANMVAGQFMTQVYGTDAVINLSAPTAVEMPPADFFPYLKTHEHVCCMIDDRPIIALFTELKVVDEHQRIGC